MEQNRWAIIYCPKLGVRRSQKRWELIRQILENNGVQYDFVQSEGPESVERLTKMLVSNDYTTLIIVGGDSALNRALNGLMSMEETKRQRVALGVIPNGRGNDFSSFWKFTEENDEQTIKWLIQRRLRKIDVAYIKSGEGTDIAPYTYHYFLNCANIGLAANIMKIKYKARRIFGFTALAYCASMLALLFQRMETKVNLRVNEERINRKMMTLCVGNCRGYGQTPNAVPYNGMLDMTIITQPEIAKFFEGIVMLFTGKFLNHKNVKAYRTPRPIQFNEIHSATVSADGVVLHDIQAPFEIGLKHEYINFIIPS